YVATPRIGLVGLLGVGPQPWALVLSCCCSRSAAQQFSLIGNIPSPACGMVYDVSLLSLIAYIVIDNHEYCSSVFVS
ncbi:MAG: hypothetical protein ACKPKO_26380, partial [Candidatus Fonsibacter sp.]